MAIGDPCERCGAPPPRAESGPFAGSVLGHDYCAFCSKDLCDRCMENGHCRESPDGKHQLDAEEDLDPSTWEPIPGKPGA